MARAATVQRDGLDPHAAGHQLPQARAADESGRAGQQSGFAACGRHRIFTSGTGTMNLPPAAL